MDFRILTLTALLAFLLALAVLPSQGPAEDHFLTVGGGYSPSGNQVSIERNVAFQQAVLERLAGRAPRLDLYFSDGDGRRPDVVYRDPTADLPHPGAAYLLARLFRDGDDLATRYRNHELPGVTGPSDPRLVDRRLGALGRTLKSGDRLILYATAHGGKAKKPEEDKREEREEQNDDEIDNPAPDFNPYDTTLYFWNRKTIPASRFEGMLDQLPSDVPVVLVMVQCYSGGFSHAIFNEANAGLALSPHPRCGFFSQVYDRPAAGCTSDVKEENYQEYSSFFWAALGGQTRTGQPVTTADYNGDGRVSFAEAHAYAVLMSDTIDVPVRTTGALLRALAPLGNKDQRQPSGAEPLLTMTGPLSLLADLARPDQRAILTGLSDQLSLDQDATIQDIQRARWRLRRQRNRAERRLRAAAKESLTAKTKAREQVQEHWEEIGDGRNRFARELVTKQADEFVEFVEGLPEYDAYQTAEERRKSHEQEVRDAKNLDVKAQRLLRTCENIIMAENLPNIAMPQIVERFKQIRALEEGFLERSEERVAAKRP